MLFDPGTIERMTLANGMRVLLKPVVGSRVVAIVTLVNAGYFDDTEEHIGLSHVVEHMFYKGSARFPPGELLRRTRTQGGYLDAETSYDTTRYSAVIPAEHFLAALELQADAFRYATAGEEELAREINVIAEEIASKADRAQAHLSEALFELLFDAHPIRRW